MVLPKIGAEEKLQEPNVEEIAIDGVMLHDRVTESDTAIVHGAVDSLLVKEMGKILVQQELHQLPLFAAAGGLSSSTKLSLSAGRLSLLPFFTVAISFLKGLDVRWMGKPADFLVILSSESDMEVRNWIEKLVGEGHGNF